jgi:hypothetical protein
MSNLQTTKKASSRANSTFWRLRHDWLTYKVPVEEGKIIQPEDYLEPGYEINVCEHWYSFVHSRKDRRKIADFSGWMNGAFFVNERAYKTFEDMFLRHGRVFPVRCSNEPHFIVLIDKMHDAIDTELSKFERIWDDGRPLVDDISQVKNIVLKVGFTTADDIFRIDHGFALSQEVIVSDAFKTRYEQFGLTGLFFAETAARVQS